MHPLVVHGVFSRRGEGRQPATMERETLCRAEHRESPGLHQKSRSDPLWMRLRRPLRSPIRKSPAAPTPSSSPGAVSARTSGGSGSEPRRNCGITTTSSRTSPGLQHGRRRKHSLQACLGRPPPTGGGSCPRGPTGARPVCGISTGAFIGGDGIEIISGCRSR